MSTGPVIYKDSYLIVPRGGAYHIYSIANRAIGHATSLKAAQDFVDGYSITATRYGTETFRKSKEVKND